MTTIYSTDRERRLRLVLRVAAVAGGVLALLLVVLVAWGSPSAGEVVGVGVTAAAVLATCLVALRALPARDRGAKVSATVAGVVTLVTGFFFAAMILGFAMIVVGLVVIVLALLRDDPDLAS